MGQLLAWLPYNQRIGDSTLLSSSLSDEKINGFSVHITKLLVGLTILFCFTEFVTMFWIGANDKLLHGNFTWQDGSPLVYSNWDTDQPSHGDEHCVLKEEGTLTWHDYPCDTEVKSVCEKP